MFSNTTRYFHDGFQRWFKRQNQIPQKKKRTWAQSATSNAVNGNIKVLDAHHLQAPRMEVVSFRAGRLPAGRIEQLPLHQNAVGQYYAFVLCECENQSLAQTGKRIGGDLGLKALLNLSDGQKEPLVRYNKQLSKQLRRWDKQPAWRRIGAEAETARDQHEHPGNVRTLADFKTYQCARGMVAKLKAHAANQRLDQLQKYTTRLVKTYDVIVLEDLNVKGLLKNHRLARAISNASWSKLVMMIQYKCAWYGKQLILVSPAYTSQICACCGAKNDLLSQWLKVREWDCPSCGVHLDRDTNAAQNILVKGNKQIA
ncbi:RNA-guided endonuclease TnpB family protein [Schleiferilactobacillus harbinensis]|jgi:putative transposase|uniref:RNA-guided endonuclease TnpB family protein n=1 Tax=Schleiferilactobacillus harbinensis TaxID=304207 RepID=A0ABU7T3P4_9LACO